jgi:hypothetical protein
MDETAIETRFRYDMKTNEIQGSCFNHKNFIDSYSFNSSHNIDEIQEALQENSIHKTNEALVIATSKINHKDIIAYPILVMPLCEKKNSYNLTNILKCIVAEFNNYSNSNIINFATDGDSTRRAIFNNLREMNHDLIELKDLPLFDQNFVLGEYGLDYVCKHLVKRLQKVFTNEKRQMKLISNGIHKKHIELFFNGTQGLEQLLNPKDKQNVPAAVKLLNLIGCPPTVQPKTQIENDIVLEIRLAGIISKLLLSIFTNTSISLLDQLISLSQLSFLLFFIYRRNKSKFLPRILYSDIQR